MLYPWHLKNKRNYVRWGGRIFLIWWNKQFRSRIPLLCSDANPFIIAVIFSAMFLKISIYSSKKLRFISVRHIWAVAAFAHTPRLSASVLQNNWLLARVFKHRKWSTAVEKGQNTITHWRKKISLRFSGKHLGIHVSSLSVRSGMHQKQPSC